MGYRNPTYIIFDGDEDGWAYRFMRGWNAQDHMDFDFRDAHDIEALTRRASDEVYIKSILRQRMRQAAQVIVLIGEKTKNLFRYVRWEIDLAIELGLPIIAVNLNESREQDDRCPPILRDRCVVHVPFKMSAIRHALDNWPNYFRVLNRDQKASGPWSYNATLYRQLGI